MILLRILRFEWKNCPIRWRRYDVLQSMDQYMEPAPHGDQDILNNSTEVHPSNRTDQTGQVVYRIDPCSSGMEFRLEPRSDDRTDHTRARLSRPSRHSNDNSRARLSLDREEPEDRHGSHPADHPDSPAGILIVTAVHLSVPEVPFAFSDHIQHPAKVILQFRTYQVVSEPLWLKQRNERKRQNMFDDDEKRVRNGDRPFTIAKRSNCDMLDQNELQTYASLEKMLHKAIFAIQQLKKKRNANTSSAPKYHNLKRGNLSSNSNSDLKTNVCFKCHMIGHYANKCQNQKPLVTLENDKVETEPEKEELSVPLPIFDDFTNEPMEGLDKEQICGHQANQEGSSSIQKVDQTQGEHCADYNSFAYNPFPFNKQRNERKRQNMFDDDEKRVRNGDRPFTIAKRSNCDMLDQNELQTYASLEKMLHKAIFAIQQLKKKRNANTSSAPKYHNLKRGNLSSNSNSDLKTNVCFKCHMIGHYANKCQNQKPLVTLENDKVETEPEKEELSVPLPIFDDFTNEPMEGLDKEQICGHQANQEGSSSIQKI
ncbi:hypothetical protein F2Q69_00012282 [Brassica cretica]|uniref:CCHC-type domain-containing protein n=1 Tax=Brassica cretica TaxID=69181 RepID=A0A8S9QPM1_BRACR|nr:hypothetical protein F2Q69_00012282 [Brassica cretica]